MIIYIAHTRPFNHSFLNELEIFNEVCILAITYHLFTFTSFVDKIEI